MLDCIIIGSGPAGIVALKELLEQNIKNVVCLEKTDKLGGTFSQTYDNLKLTSSTTFSMFSDFWIGDNANNHFWSKDEAVNYWNNYSEHFGIKKYINYNSEVTSIVDHKTYWELATSSGEVFSAKKIILALGNNRVPKFPDWKSALSKIKYSHSSSYKNADRFKGKRVLVVGGGESGSDLAYEISAVARTSWISLRNSTGWVVPRKRGDIASDNSTHRGIWNLPKSHGLKLSERINRKELSRKDPVFDTVVMLNKLAHTKYGLRGVYGTKTLSLPKAIVEHNCELVREIIEIDDLNRTVKTSDGKTLENIDEIVFCTGYKNEIKILPQQYQNINPRELYKHMIHPDLADRILWLGYARPGFGSQFPILEMQSRLMALIISKKHMLPSRIEMKKTALMDTYENMDRFQENAYNVKSLVDYHTYMDDLSKVIGCEPPLRKLFFTNPKLWVKVFFGPTQATQFRLKGPGEKTELAKHIIYKLPKVKLNNIIKEGIKGRIHYAMPWNNSKFKSVRV